MSAYEIAFQGEVLMEKGAEVGADLFRYSQTTTDEDNRKMVLALQRLIWAAKQQILAAESEMDFVRIEAKFDLIRDILTVVGEMENG